MHRDVTFENAVAFARDLVRIPGLSGEEAAVAARVLSELKLLQFDECWCDDIGNIMARIKGKSQAPPVMLSSHLDVVDVGKREEWEYPPFGGEVADGCLHGRGSVDCKGPLALQVYAAASLIESRPLGDVYLAFTVFEEKGSWGMGYAIEHLPERPAAVVLGEATSGDICVGHRGRIEATLTIRGESAHASMPDRGSNPLDLVPDLLDALRDFASELPAHPVLPRSTLAPTRIQSRPDNGNMIPEEVCITVDWRVLPRTDGDNVQQLRSFLRRKMEEKVNLHNPPLRLTVEEARTVQRAYTGLELFQSVSTDGYILSATHPLVSAAVHSIYTVTGRQPAIRHWTFGTDGSYSCGRHGIPTLGYGPGNESDAHTNRERLDLESARSVYTAYPTLLEQLQRSLIDLHVAEREADAWKNHWLVRCLKRV